MYWQIRQHIQSVDAIAARSLFSGSTVTVGSVTVEGLINNVSADMFRLLRWSPAAGRFWTSDEEASGQTDVAVIGYRVWREHFRGDLSVLGEKVTLGEEPRTYRVIGVAPEMSDRPELDFASAPVWIPLLVPRTGTTGYWGGILARMKPGVSTTQLSGEVARIIGPLDWQPRVTPLLESYVTNLCGWMLLALGAAGLVVLIGCVNAANLMLTRASGRAQELAVRASLGASRRRLAAMLLAEGLLLSVSATAVAVIVAIAGVQLAKSAITTMLLGIFRSSAISLNGRVLAAAAAAAVITGVLVALVPAWQTSRAPLSSLLKDATAASTGRRRWRSVFLVTEVATVVVLLVVSWLFVVSLINVVGIDLGIDRANLVAVKPRAEFQGSVDEVKRRLEGLPGVSSVAVSFGASPPLIGRAFGGAWGTTSLRRAEPATGDSAATIKALDYSVTANYFDVAGIRFRRGQTFSDDAAFNATAVVLDENAARQLFGDADPLGRSVRRTDPDGIYTVVGIVPYVYARGAEDRVEPSAYFALQPNPNRKFAALFVKTSKPADQVIPIMVEALKPLAPRTPPSEPYIVTANEAVKRLTAQRRFNAGLMSAFGLVGVIIGAAGVYAVMASFVAQQTREIGVRLALGATPVRIQRGVLASAWRHLLIGLVIGVPIAWWLSRGFASLLFQVTPADVSVYVGVSAILLLVGFTAAWLPARRAAKVDPTISLRT